MTTEVLPSMQDMEGSLEPVSKLSMTTSRKRRRMETNVLATAGRHCTIKSLVSQSQITTGTPLLDEQAVFQPSSRNSNPSQDAVLGDMGRDLAINQRRMVELESAVHEAWTMREMLAVQILASQGAITRQETMTTQPTAAPAPAAPAPAPQKEQPQQTKEEQSNRTREWKEGLTSGRYWSEGEHIRFLEGIVKYGVKNVREIAQSVGSRNATQVRTHLQKYMLRRDEWDRRFQPRDEIVGDLDRMLIELQNINETARRQKDAQMEIIMGRAPQQARIKAAPSHPVYQGTSPPGTVVATNAPPQREPMVTLVQ
eukprot:TRINITY_DN2_c0_g3_i1.p1 TRINITY_DN2_c0_g3~~TRINITY_DN2_c0_g3_i1.p1  ORF type:complete len:312 (-),score=18.11 TRINITY_DN2_c0_g3_i1:112-1047(-)